MKLTPAGEAFARECPLIIDTFKRGVTNAKEAAAGKRGTICIGLQRDLFEKFTVDLLNSFRKKYPDIGFNIRLLGINEMIKELGVTPDAAITSGQEGDGDFGRLLLSDRHNCAVLPPDYPLAGRSSIRMEELKNERLLPCHATAPTTGMISFCILPWMQILSRILLLKWSLFPG